MAIFRIELETKLSCLTLAPSICENVLFLDKKTFLNVEPKLFYLDILRLELGKATLLWYFTSAPSNFNKYKILSKENIFKFGTKIALIVYFQWDGLSKPNIVLEISILEFVNIFIDLFYLIRYLHSI